MLETTNSGIFFPESAGFRGVVIVDLTDFACLEQVPHGSRRICSILTPGYDMDLDGVRYIQAALATPGERLWGGSIVTLGDFPVERRPGRNQRSIKTCQSKGTCKCPSQAFASYVNLL